MSLQLEQMWFILMSWVRFLNLSLEMYCPLTALTLHRQPLCPELDNRTHGLQSIT